MLHLSYPPLTATIGSVVLSGPAGVARTDPVTYAPPGYNHVYGALAFLASANHLDATISTTVSSSLRKPMLIIGTFRCNSPVLRLNGAILTPDVDYFASPRPAASEIWITLNRDLSGATRLEIECAACTQAPGRVALLRGKKVLPSDTLFSWDPEPSSAGGYHLYAVAAKTLIPMANVSQTPVCSAPPGALSCVHSASLVSPPTLIFYQVVGVCANGADEGPI